MCFSNHSITSLCHNVNLIHNYHNQRHTLERFDIEKQEHTGHNKQQHTRNELREKVRQQKHGMITAIYDLRTIQIHYTSFGSFIYKKQKIADICVPPYIDDSIYLTMTKELEEYFHNKTFTVVHLHDDYIYLYYEGECINTMINNMIVYNMMNKQSEK